MTTVAHAPSIERNAPISTWFGVGGVADLLAKPANERELAAILEQSPSGAPVRALGDGANLLVDDAGVDGVVISFERLARIDILDHDDAGLVRAQAGANLPKLLVQTARAGLAGLEGLAGIPASVGGALAMNAGGAFGSIESAVERVRCFDLADATTRELDRDDIDFDYRTSNLHKLLVLDVDFRLKRDDPACVRSRLKEAMAHKKQSQPLRDKSAGCVFKNPVVAGERVSAGRLIDEAGCKGMRAGGASVSDVHANFIITRKGASARDILDLLEQVRQRVLERTAIELDREIIVWKRGQP